METRRCPRCRRTSEEVAFGIDRSHKDSLTTYCRECAAEKAHLQRLGLASPLRGRPRLFTETTATCSRCRRDLPRSEFGRGSQAKAIRGCDTYCRACTAAKHADQIRTPRGLFPGARHIAKARGIAWLLTREEYDALRLLSCHYCAGPLPKSGVGLDRKDNKGAYDTGNVVPCCTACNLSRNTLCSPEEMLIVGRAIAAVWTERTAQGIPCGPVRGWGAGAPRKYQQYPEKVAH